MKKFLNIISKNYSNNLYIDQLNTFNVFKSKYHDTKYIEDINLKNIDKINKYLFVQIYPKIENNNILDKIKIKKLYWIDHPFGPNFNTYLKNLKRIDNKRNKIFIKTFQNYKNLVFNYIPWFPNTKLKNTKIKFKKKKYDILFISGKSKVNYLSILANPIIFYLAFKNINFQGDYFKQISLNKFDKFLFSISFGNKSYKLHILWQLVRYLRRRKIKNFLEKIDKKIVFSGSKQFMPKNCCKYYSWLKGTELKKVLSLTKVMIVTDSVTNTPNERFNLMKYGILPFSDGFEDYKKFSLNGNFRFYYNIENFHSKLNLCINKFSNNKSFIQKNWSNYVKDFNKLYFKNPILFVKKKLMI